MEERARASLAAIAGVSPEVAEALFRGDWRSADEVAKSSTSELATVPGIGNLEAAGRLVESAARAAEIEKARVLAEREASAAPAAPSASVEEQA